MMCGMAATLFPPVGLPKHSLGRFLAVFACLAGSLGPARGQAVTLEDLEGTTVEATVVRDQVVLREGRRIPVKFQNELTIGIGPEAKLQVAITPTSQGPRGKRHGETRRATATVEKVRELKTLGGGYGLWVFSEDGTLTFLRTYKGGAFKRTIAFARGPEGLTCKAEEAFARENSRGPIILDSAVGTGEVQILSAKQISSRCRVVKAQ
jgi:hypothetical protein